MGILLKTLSAPSAASVKRSGLFEEVKDRIDGAMFQQDLDQVEAWLDDNDHAYPATWREHFNDMIERQREEIHSEDVGVIMRDKWDF